MFSVAGNSTNVSLDWLNRMSYKKYLKSVGDCLCGRIHCCYISSITKIVPAKRRIYHVTPPVYLNQITIEVFLIKQYLYKIYDSFL